MLTVVILIAATLAVARVTRLFVEDRLLLSWRRWMIRRFGEESLVAYLTTCPWCVSIYVATAVMPATVWLTVHSQHPGTPWYVTTTLAALSIPAASHVAGMLNRE